MMGASVNSDLDLSTRLLNGARVLGSIWKNAEEPKSCGWGFCGCYHSGQGTKWCEAKRQFYVLLTKTGRDPHSGDFAVIESMTLAEADAANVVVEVEVPVGKIRVGGGGAISWADLGKMTGSPKEAASLFQVLSNFKGSVVHQVVNQEEGSGKSEVQGVDQHDAQGRDPAEAGTSEVRA